MGTVRKAVPPGFKFRAVHQGIGAVRIFRNIRMEVHHAIPIGVNIGGEVLRTRRNGLVPAGERADILMGVRIGIITVKLLRPETAAAPLIVGNTGGDYSVFEERQVWKFQQLPMDSTVLITVDKTELS